MDFYDSNGLINSRADEVKSENSPLISLEYILVRKLLGKHTPSVNQALYNFIEEVKIREGLYDQRDFIVGDGCPEDYCSHDQLSTFMIYSYSNGWNWHKSIWKEIKRQVFRYDNIEPDNKLSKRVVHPRDIIYYGILNDVWWADAAFPIFAKMMEITCKNDKLGKDGLPATSGKLLAFTRCVALRDIDVRFAVLFRKLTDIIRRNKVIGNWERVFEVYYPDINHPIRQAIIQGKEDAQDSDRIFS